MKAAEHNKVVICSMALAALQPGNGTRLAADWRTYKSGPAKPSFLRPPYKGVRVPYYWRAL